MGRMRRKGVMWYWSFCRTASAAISRHAAISGVHGRNGIARQRSLARQGGVTCQRGNRRHVALRDRIHSWRKHRGTMKSLLMLLLLLIMVVQCRGGVVKAGGHHGSGVLSGAVGLGFEIYHKYSVVYILLVDLDYIYNHWAFFLTVNLKTLIFLSLDNIYIYL